MSDSVKVAVRIRPLIQRERDAEILWTNTERSIQQQKGTGKSAVPYHFDRVFGISETTDDVYKEIAVPIIAGAMLGFNGTIFAYGQTSSGKTFTMMGNEKNPGIIPGVISEIFDTIENNPEREYLIRVSYLEIYNENVTDLLTSDKKPLDVREDTEGKVFVANLTEELVNNKKQIIKLMAAGDSTRHVGATNMNESSSRSHAIFKIIIESRVRDQEGAVMVSQLNLVDLAGSEKAKSTGATGQRLTEGGFINKSLFILGNVISQLSDNNVFISYRDSRLTRILQNSLGGNSKTAIICNISPAALEETHSSLRFATNAKRITNKPVQNEVVSDEAMMQRYKKEIDTLKKELQQTRNLKAGGLLEVNEQLQQQLAAKEAVQAAQEERITRLTALICVSSQMRPTTPGPLTTAAKRKRRETWCPGKAGKAANKPAKSLPIFEETLERDEDLYSPRPVTVRTVDFQLPDSSPEALPDLTVDASRFSNEDLEFMETGCQTESWETEPPQKQPDSDVLAAKEHQIQELNAEVENLTKIIDDNLQDVGETEAKLNHEIYSTKERLHEVEELNSALREKLAAAEEHGTLMEQELHNVKAEKTKPSVRTSSFGGLELVQQQLEKLRAQLEEKEAVLQEKNREMSLLKTQHNDAVLLVEEVLDEVRDVKAEKDAMRDERDGLKIQLEDVRIHIEKREEEFKEMEEFLTIERDLQDNSIMYKQYGEEMVTDLQNKASVLEKTSMDSQTVLVDLNKKLATSNTEIQDLQLKLNATENELKQLTNDKADFEMYQDLEREKHKRRETELTAQLEEAYRENSELRSAAGTSVMGQSLDMSLQAALACHMGGGGGGNLEASMAAADNLQVEQLNAQIADLQHQVSRLADEIGEVKAERENAVAMLETMKGEMAKVSDEQTSLQEEKRMLEEKLTTLQQEKLTLEEQYKHEAEQMHKSEEGEQHRLETENLALESDKQDLEKERSALAEGKTCLEQEKITFNEEKQVFQQKLSEVEEDKSVFEQQKAVLGEEKETLEQEKMTLEEEKLKIEEERVVIKEAKESLQTEKNTLDSDKVQLKNLKNDLEEDRLAFEEEKIMEKEMKESVMEEERKLFEEKKEELQEERRLLEKKREEIETERVKSSEKVALEEQQKSLEEMLNCLKEERNAFDVDKNALAEEKQKQTTLEEERNMLQLEKRAMDEHIAALELEIKALKEERDSQQGITSSSDDGDQYKEQIAALEKEIEDAKKAFGEEKEQLQKEGSTSEEEKKALEKELEDLKKTYEEEKEQIQKESQLSDEEKEALLRELDELKKASADEKEMLEKENSLSEQERQLLEEENKTLEEERKSLEVESHKTTEECEALKDKLNGLEEERKNLLAQLQKAHDEVVQLKEELSQLRSEWSKKEEQIAEEEIERRETALSELRSELESQRKEDKEQAEKELQEQILAIRAEAMAKLEEAKTMLPAEDLDETGMMGAEVQLEMARAELERLTTRLKQRELDLHEKLATITKLGTTIKSLEEKKEEDQETIQMLHEEIENLKNGTEAIVIEVKEERDAAWNTIKEMQEEVDRLTKREEELEQQVELHTEELEQLNECVTEQHAELAKEHEQVATLEDQLMDLKTSLATLSQEREDDVERLTTELDLKQLTLTELEEQLSTFTSGTTSAAEVAKLQEQLEDYKERLAFAHQESDSGHKLITDVASELEQLNTEKERNESEFNEKIAELEDQLSTFKSGTTSHQQVARSGTTSAQELAKLQAKLQAELQYYKECLAATCQERDSQRKLMDEADDEQEQLKEEKERNESEFKRKIAKLEDQLSTFKTGTTSHQQVATSGTASAQEVAKLQAEVQKYKDCLAATCQERDSERKLMDEADDELKQLKEEKERNESEFKRKIAKLEDQLSTFKSGTTSHQQVATSGTTSTQEVAKLRAELQKYKECLAATVQERDSQRKHMDEADDEQEQLKEEKERNESEFKRKIAKLEGQLSTFKLGTTSHQQVATSGTTSAQEVAKLQAELQKYKECLAATCQERDSERKLMDEADDELKHVKEEKERNESEFKRKIAKLEDQLSTFKSGTTSHQQVATSGTTSAQELAKLQAELQKYKECLAATCQERDSQRKLMDEADDEQEQLKEEKERNESEFKRKIAKLEDTLAKTQLQARVDDSKRQLSAVKPGADVAVNETQEMSALKTKLARTEIQERRLKQNVGLMEDEIRSYKERVNSMRSEIRRLQNQNNDTSFMPNQRQGKSLPAPQAPAPVSAPSDALGIIGSVKVLALGSDNARLERELKKVKKQLQVQQTYIEKYHNTDHKRVEDFTVSEERALKSLPNGASPAKPPAANLKTKLFHATAGATTGATGATAGATKRAAGATAHDDPYAASLDITTSGALLGDDVYAALLGLGNGASPATGATKRAAGATAHDDPYAASLGITTSGALLEEDPYVALLSGGNNVIRDLYEPLFREESTKPAANKEVEGCSQQ